jgi:hypothetical protein
MKPILNFPHDMRTAEEKQQDAKLELHLDYLCGDDCQHCEVAAAIAAEESRGG